MKIFISLFISFLIVSCSSYSDPGTQSQNQMDSPAISSKRLPPKNVAPLIVGEITFLASMNEIIAMDEVSQIELWRKKIYDIVYDENLERDVQDVFIDSMKFHDNTIIIRNELNNWYFLDLTTKNVYPTTRGITRISKNGYTLSLSDSNPSEFEHYSKTDSTNVLLDTTQCLQQGLITETTAYALKLKLNNGQFFTLKKERQDDQFYGFSLIHFDSLRNSYIVWENWLEAGHPIMINATNGDVTQIFGESFCSNVNNTLTANYADDIESGWTPNGIQLFRIKNKTFEKLFEFDPSESQNENWGPVDLKWKNDSTLLIECITHHPANGYQTIYKQLQFERE